MASACDVAKQFRLLRPHCSTRKTVQTGGCLLHSCSRETCNCQSRLPLASQRLMGSEATNSPDHPFSQICRAWEFEVHRTCEFKGTWPNLPLPCNRDTTRVKGQNANSVHYNTEGDAAKKTLYWRLGSKSQTVSKGGAGVVQIRYTAKANLLPR
jgi:hypothetical protein